MNVHNTIDVTAYTRVASTRANAALRLREGEVEPVVLGPTKQGSRSTEVKGVNDAYEHKKAPTAARVDYNQSVAQARELKPVNDYPKNATAIDTFLNIKHYSGGEHIVNTYA